MTDQSFSAHLRRLVDPIWEAQHNHPFIRGIGDGTLALDRFRYWVRQDYIYLIDYSRLFALAAARAPDLATMERFADLLRSTLVTEMALHRSYAAEFGISASELESETPSPTTRGYVDFLLRVAALGDFAELVAALLPCMWGFSEIGLRLADRPGPSDPRYAAWIDMYASSEFADLANWCRELLDRLAKDVPPSGRRHLEEAFLTSSRYELAFWEASYNLEQWPT